MAKIAWKKFKYADLLVVNWKDIVSTEAWISEEEASNLEPMNCVSVGWLLSKEDDVLRLASTIGGNDDTNVIVIPKGVIQSVKVVEYDRD